MGKLSFSHQEVRDLLFTADNYRDKSSKRSSARHTLMGLAAAAGDDSLWDKVGAILVEACRVDDLSAQVSDHFVDDSPDVVFAKFAKTCPYRRFVGWRRRADELKQEK